MCDRLTGQKVINLNDLKCRCGCEEIVVSSYARQYRMHSSTSYISIGAITCKKCGETLLEWSM